MVAAVAASRASATVSRTAATPRRTWKWPRIFLQDEYVPSVFSILRRKAGVAPLAPELLDDRTAKLTAMREAIAHQHERWSQLQMQGDEGTTRDARMRAEFVLAQAWKQVLNTLRAQLKVQDEQVVQNEQNPVGDSSMTDDRNERYLCRYTWTFLGDLPPITVEGRSRDSAADAQIHAWEQLVERAEEYRSRIPHALLEVRRRQREDGIIAEKEQERKRAENRQAQMCTRLPDDDLQNLQNLHDKMVQKMSSRTSQKLDVKESAMQLKDFLSTSSQKNNTSKTIFVHSLEWTLRGRRNAGGQLATERVHVERGFGDTAYAARGKACELMLKNFGCIPAEVDEADRICASEIRKSARPLESALRKAMGLRDRISDSTLELDHNEISAKLAAVYTLFLPELWNAAGENDSARRLQLLRALAGRDGNLPLHPRTWEGLVDDTFTITSTSRSPSQCELESFLRHKVSFEHDVDCLSEKASGSSSTSPSKLFRSPGAAEYFRKFRVLAAMERRKALEMVIGDRSCTAGQSLLDDEDHEDFCGLTVMRVGQFLDPFLSLTGGVATRGGRGRGEARAAALLDARKDDILCVAEQSPEHEDAGHESADVELISAAGEDKQLSTDTAHDRNVVRHKNSRRHLVRVLRKELVSCPATHSSTGAQSEGTDCGDLLEINPRKGSVDGKKTPVQKRVPRLYCRVLYNASPGERNSPGEDRAEGIALADDDLNYCADPGNAFSTQRLADDSRVSVFALSSETTARRQIAALRAACFRRNIMDSADTGQLQYEPGFVNDVLFRHVAPSISISSTTSGTRTSLPPPTHVVRRIFGPPGTGKTFTACGIVNEWRFAYEKEKILCVADSNVAADNLHKHLLRQGIGSLRFRSVNKVVSSSTSSSAASASAGAELGVITQKKKHEETFQNYGEKFQTWRENLHKAQVVVTTCCGVGHPVFAPFLYPRVILDEATQSTEISSLISLGRGCRELVLIGDPKQLGPTVLNNGGSGKELETTLFERLGGTKIWNNNSEQGDVEPMISSSDDVELVTQRRMHPELLEFPNEEWYGGKLVTHEEELEQTARKTRLEGVLGEHERRVTFVHVEDAGEEQSSSSLSSASKDDENDGTTFSSQRDAGATGIGSKLNRQEADAVVGYAKKLVEDLKEHPTQEMKDDEAVRIAVITPYSAQQKLLDRKLQSLTQALNKRNQNKNSVKINILVSTVDGFQGSEADIVLLSLVRTKEMGFLKDPRRMNVALTRAKEFLRVFGNREVLEHGGCRAWQRWVRKYGAA
eukprot:g8599.t1